MSRPLPTCNNSFRSARLLTLTRAGGVGKTRLAVEVAAAAQHFPDGSWLIELASIAHPAHVAQAVAAALAVKERQGRPVEEVLTGALQEQQASPSGR